MNHIKPLVLIILDGWGINPQRNGNAVALGKMPVLDRLFADYPNTQLMCSGEAVGLPDGIMGNSEVGHMNIGAGRVVLQDLLRIDKSIREGTFFQNSAFNEVMDTVLENDVTLHLMGLLSDSGVHSHLNHLFALLELASRKGLKRVAVHAITDGRDAPPDSGLRYIQQLQAYLSHSGTGRIASICGRYYAMDRDNRWERTEAAYRLYSRGQGVDATDPVVAIQQAYARGETDEFIKPVMLQNDASGEPGVVTAHDAIIFFNFRADRARQITRAFTEKAFDRFSRDVLLVDKQFLCMTLYDADFVLPIAYPPVSLTNILGQVIAEHGLRQLRIAETEKYAHVTYFFNGGVETPFSLEDRCLIPSPRDVPTYDYKPEMSAYEVTDEVIRRLESNPYHLVVLNFANMDMVGHTGVLEAGIKACEAVDTCLSKILKTIRSLDGIALITADHGNAEIMVEPDGSPHTAHSKNPVPFILVDEKRRHATLHQGKLADIAPTILALLDISQPPEMTGRSLLRN